MKQHLRALIDEYERFELDPKNWTGR